MRGPRGGGGGDQGAEGRLGGVRVFSSGVIIIFLLGNKDGPLGQAVRGRGPWVEGPVGRGRQVDQASGHRGGR